ncbi:Flp family type IVb pilin [Zavarzinia compransoris]|uniref:Flp family type IVb pilin n=1 Tax=Zavarzinia compransoris TaxID=1264899 RepID=A0A317EDG5_9PROT|nr:Flp family type IVb pilin [Zavarzinia compransoris]PWR23255.1 Flp family type IVb pilin [Zavarzinia compransoris]TDP46181.1 pilus assembly protein Flp/PilA [Zavarzinia compransoris]
MLRKMIASLRKTERGATAIEYALIAALIAVAAIGAMTLVGGGLNATFNTVSGKLGGGSTPAPAPGPTGG